uniref:NKAP domain containing 1 n=1 Tax=Naja naja TaxID=35670 RepID=A0A8C6XBH5_NAJNA
MSRVPLGKVLLRNVIRHTDAHNKIQEESEMWKIREMEKQSQEIHWGKQERTLLNSSSSRMRSDGFDEDSQQASWRTRNMPVMAVTLEDDLRHARYWNKKLYECEANMPDRWGHSGYKELYPEEFDTDSDRELDREQNSVNGQRKSQSGKPSSAKLPKKKKAKKSHKKKQKKKSHKKKKKKKKREAGAASSQESEGSEGEPPKRNKKKRHKDKKAPEGPPASSSDPGSGSSKASSCLSSRSGDSDSEEPARKRRKRQASLSERTGDRAPEKRSKRKNWKVAADENSEDSSEED